MKPIVHGLEAEYGDRMGFVYINVDDPQTLDIKRALEFEYMPYFVLLDGNGTILKQWNGQVTREAFVDEFYYALNP